MTCTPVRFPPLRRADSRLARELATARAGAARRACSHLRDEPCLPAAPAAPRGPEVGVGRAGLSVHSDDLRGHRRGLVPLGTAGGGERAGPHETAAQAHGYYVRLAGEVNRACQIGHLRCEGHRDSMLEPVRLVSSRAASGRAVRRGPTHHRLLRGDRRSRGISRRDHRREVDRALPAAQLRADDAERLWSPASGCGGHSAFSPGIAGGRCVFSSSGSWPGSSLSPSSRARARPHRSFRPPCSW